MVDSKGFDLWADGYDKSVSVSDRENMYPFAGYNQVLSYIFQTIMDKQNPVVLDIGFGTGALTTELYKHGCTIYGQDFSQRMIEISQEKMPDAKLYQGNFASGLVEPLSHINYDFIVATYSLHHLTDEEKICFLHTLIERLNKDGKILIGDVAFKTRQELNECRQELGSKWDEQEVYFVAEELRSAFPNLSFMPVSYCAGVLTLTR